MSAPGLFVLNYHEGQIPQAMKLSSFPLYSLLLTKDLVFSTQNAAFERVENIGRFSEDFWKASLHLITGWTLKHLYVFLSSSIVKGTQMALYMDTAETPGSY